MWFSIGYLIPQKGDRSAGGAPPVQYYLLAENGVSNILESEDGADLMVQEIAS